MIRINFSGHPIDPMLGFTEMPLVGVNLDVTTAATLQREIQALLQSLDAREALLTGERAQIVLPGLAPAAALLLAEWHGQFGSFPYVRWAVRTDEGFTFPQDAVADLAEVRESARTRRTPPKA